MLEKGLVQIYTGDGKGKTTAGLGLALRAAGHGNKVLIYQFLKPSTLDIGERRTLSSLKSIKVEALDIPWDMTKSPNDPKAISIAQKAIHKSLERLTDSAAKREYDILILDEIVYCLSKGLAALDDVKNLIEKRDSHVEIVLTGRGATPELISMADLVSEIRLIKHPYEKGASARRGIEF